MRALTFCSVRRVLAVLALLGLAASRSNASPIYTITDLGAEAHSPYNSPLIPDSLRVERPVNSSGQRETTVGVYAEPGPIGTPVKLGPIGFYAAFVDQNGQKTRIGDLGATLHDSSASAINNAGQVVGTAGTAFTDGIWHGFLYTEGRSFDLNTLIPALPDSGWMITNAVNIDENHRILATATYGGVQHAVLLTPATVPEPTTLAILGLASTAAGVRALRRRRSR